DLARLLRPGRQRRHAPAQGPPPGRRGPARRRRPRARRGSRRPGDRLVTATTDVTATVARLRREVAELHGELTRNGLVIWTAGNVLARGPGRELMVIKPSGVSYDELPPESMVVTDFDGVLVEGEHAPSS